MKIYTHDGTRVRSIRHGFSLCLLFFCGGLAVPNADVRADIADRIRAVVNGEIIAQSDVRDAMALQTLSQPNSKPPLTEDLESRALRQLIDRKVILIHAARRPEPIPVSVSDVEEEINAIRSLYPDAQTFTKTVQSFGLTPGRLHALIRERLVVLRFVDATFRPQIAVTEAEVVRYYDTTFVPQARRKGVMDIPSLSEVAGEIRQILIEQKINRLLDAWLKQERGIFSVHILGE